MARGSGEQQAVATLARDQRSRQTRRAPFVVIAGNVGAGKSTLSEALADRYQVELFAEPWQENPFLQKAVEDPHHYRLASDRWFVEAAIEQHRHLVQSGGVHDRGVDEHVQVFAGSHFEAGYFDAAGWNAIQSLYDQHLAADANPDLLIYLHTTPEIALKRIRVRGRDFEAGIDTAFLSDLHRRLVAMAGSWRRCPVLRLEPFELDDYPLILSQIDAQLPAAAQHAA